MRILIPIMFLLGSCATKSSNEISEMALECFKNKQGITIQFIPHPENKLEQKAE